MRGSTILLSYAKGSRGLLITAAHLPPPIIRGSTLPLSYAKGSRGLLITPATPLVRGSTILLSYGKGSRGLLITAAHLPPPLLGVLLSRYHMPRGA